MKRKIMNFWNKIKKLGIRSSLKVIAESWKPRNYQFVQWVIFYVLFVIGGGVILIGNRFMEKWGRTLRDFFFSMSVFIFIIIVILALGGIILKKKERVLSPTIQWWIFIIVEGILLDGIFLFHDNMALFKVFDFDNSVDLIYVWISLIPILFAGIHIGCKVGYGYRLNDMFQIAYYKLKSFFTESLMLSFLLSVLLSIGNRP